MDFSVFTKLCNHHQKSILHFHQPKKKVHLTNFSTYDYTRHYNIHMPNLMGNFPFCCLYPIEMR